MRRAQLALTMSIFLVMALVGIIPSIAKVASATPPTITAYGISPTNAISGTWIQCWLTYTDADNDAPTYVRLERFSPPYLQPPIYNMVANDSGDTTYTDGKQYYYNWYYFPFVGTAFIQFQVKSGADAQVGKNVVEFQIPSPILKHSGVVPLSNVAGNYTFFTNYSTTFNNAPAYMRVIIDGTTHGMGRNNSTQTTWITGVDYNYTIYLGVGDHSYSFHFMDGYSVCGDQSNGVYWLIVSPTIWFMSSPSLNGTVNETYSYQPTVGNPNNVTLTWTLMTNATGLSVDPINGTLTGSVGLAGLYFVNLSVTDGASVLSQNFSLLIGPSWLPEVANLVLAIMFGFGLIILSLIDRKRAIWPVFAGFVWLTISVVTFYNFGVQWMVIGIGIGLILMLEGAMKYASGRKT